MKAVYLSRSDIQAASWDACVYHSVNSLPYALTAYLDAMAPVWGGVVYGEYEAVFPLPYTKKFHLYRLNQPPFCQQLGIFSPSLSLDIVKDCLAAIPFKHAYIDVYFHSHEVFTHTNLQLKPRVNLILPLTEGYKKIREGYSENLKRNLKKAEQARLRMDEIPPLSAIQFFVENVASKLSSIPASVYASLGLALKGIHYRSLGVVNDRREMLAAGIFLFHHQRVINILPSSNEEGKKVGASPFLLDGLISEHAGQELIFDFEGSMIENVARFYRSFGAQEEIYWQWKENRLPWYAKLIKK